MLCVGVGVGVWLVCVCMCMRACACVHACMLACRCGIHPWYFMGFMHVPNKTSLHTEPALLSCAPAVDPHCTRLAGYAAVQGVADREDLEDQPGENGLDWHLGVESNLAQLWPLTALLFLLFYFLLCFHPFSFKEPSHCLKYISLRPRVSILTSGA